MSRACAGARRLDTRPCGSAARARTSRRPTEVASPVASMRRAGSGGALHGRCRTAGWRAPRSGRYDRASSAAVSSMQPGRWCAHRLRWPPRSAAREREHAASAGFDVRTSNGHDHAGSSGTPERLADSSRQMFGTTPDERPVGSSTPARCRKSLKHPRRSFR